MHPTRTLPPAATCNDDLISVDPGTSELVRGPLGPRPPREGGESLQVKNRRPWFTISDEHDSREVVADVVEHTMLASAPPVAAGGHGPLTRTLAGPGRHFAIDSQAGAVAAPDHRPPMDPGSDATDSSDDCNAIRIRINVRDVPEPPERVSP